MRILNLVLSAILFAHCSNLFAMGSHKPLPKLEPVQNVDLDRYMGKWYEIARLPHFFEMGCVGATAEYSFRSDGKIDVRNMCRIDSCSGRVSEANGVARVIDPIHHSKLKVSFYWLFSGKYWILELDPQYNYAVVGSPNRKHFWILSRTPAMDEALFKSILQRFEALGFNFENLAIPATCE